MLLSVSNVRQVLSKLQLNIKDRQPVLDKIEELEEIIRHTNFGLWGGEATMNKERLFIIMDGLFVILGSIYCSIMISTWIPTKEN